MTATRTYTVSLPWPSRDQIKALSPNGRPKLRDKMREKKKARAMAHALTREVIGRDEVASVTSMAVLWCQPDRRARDDDNLIGLFKAFRDGIAQALKVDDKTFRPTHDPDGPIVPGGQIIVTIEAALR